MPLGLILLPLFLPNERCLCTHKSKSWQGYRCSRGGRNGHQILQWSDMTGHSIQISLWSATWTTWLYSTTLHLIWIDSFIFFLSHPERTCATMLQHNCVTQFCKPILKHFYSSRPPPAKINKVETQALHPRFFKESQQFPWRERFLMGLWRNSLCHWQFCHGYNMQCSQIDCMTIPPNTGYAWNFRRTNENNKVRRFDAPCFNMRR